MKKLMFSFAISLIASVMMVSASNIYSGSPANAVQNNAVQNERVAGIGMMMLKGDVWVIRVETSAGITDYVPLNLPKEFMYAGIPVRFAGVVVPVSDTGRLIGIQIYLSGIKVNRGL